MCILCPTCSKWTMTASDKKVATIGEELYKFVSVQWFYIDKKIYGLSFEFRFYPLPNRRFENFRFIRLPSCFRYQLLLKWPCGLPFKFRFYLVRIQKIRELPIKSAAILFPISVDVLLCQLRPEGALPDDTCSGNKRKCMYNHTAIRASFTFASRSICVRFSLDSTPFDVIRRAFECPTKRTCSFLIMPNDVER